MQQILRHLYRFLGLSKSNRSTPRRHGANGSSTPEAASCRATAAVAAQILGTLHFITVIDVGTGQSPAPYPLNPLARLIGFEPDAAECARLNRQVASPLVERYIAAGLGRCPARRLAQHPRPDVLFLLRPDPRPCRTAIPSSRRCVRSPPPPCTSRRSPSGHAPKKCAISVSEARHPGLGTGDPRAPPARRLPGDRSRGRIRSPLYRSAPLHGRRYLFAATEFRPLALRRYLHYSERPADRAAAPGALVLRHY